MNMILFVGAVSILFFSSLPWVALARLERKTDWLISLYLVGAANITLTCYITNSFYLLNWPVCLLITHLIIGGLGWLIWRHTGKPSVWRTFQNWKIDAEFQILRRDPALLVLTMGMFIFYLFAFAQVIFIPQNNVDSLAAHLSRIGFWRQYGSFFPWPTFMPSQVWYPVNAQLQTYWTLLFLGNDRLVGAIQWLAVLVSGLSIFGMARFLGYGDRPAKFAALLFLSFPLVALQATTTQTDLITVAFFLSAVYFVSMGLKSNQQSLLILSAVSTGIGLGIKKSYFILLPILAVVAVLLVLQFSRRTLKSLALWVLTTIMAVLIFSAYMYIFNWRYWGDPFGQPNYVESILQSSTIEQRAQSVQVAASKKNLRMISFQLKAGTSTHGVLNELLYNIPRLTFQAFDTSGLPNPLDGYAHKVKARLARMLFNWIGFTDIEGTAYSAPGHEFNFDQKNENEESHAWFGPLSILLIFPALLKKTWQGLHRRSFLLLIPVSTLMIFTPLEIVFRPGWDPYQGRYFAPVVALCAPLMAEWFKENGHARVEWLWSGLALLFVAVTLLYNPAKPTLGKLADDFHVWHNDRAIIQTLQRKNDRAVYELIEQSVPAHARLGYYTPFFFMEYPLFGDDTDRPLVTIMSAEQATDPVWLKAHSVDYLLIRNTTIKKDVPANYSIHATIYGWTIYHAATP